MKKMMIATLAAASVLLAVANQALLARRLMPFRKKVLCNAGSVMDYLGSLMPMLTVSLVVLMLIFVVVLPLLYLVTTRK